MHCVTCTCMWSSNSDITIALGMYVRPFLHTWRRAIGVHSQKGYMGASERRLRLGYQADLLTFSVLNPAVTRIMLQNMPFSDEKKLFL